MEKNNTTLRQLIDAAQNEDWDFVDGNINISHLTGEPIVWALKDGLVDQDQNIRDLAATLLDKSDEEINIDDIKRLEDIMTSDSYHIVQYRIAIALYKRGDRNQSVLQKMQSAKNDPDVGELANSYLE